MKGKTLFSFLILTILKTTAATAPTVSPNKKYSFAGTFPLNEAPSASILHLPMEVRKPNGPQIIQFPSLTLSSIAQS